MPPKKKHQIDDTTADLNHNLSPQDSGISQTSQSQTNNHMLIQNALKKRQEDTRQRRKERRHAIEKTHVDRVKKVHGKVEQCVAKHEAAVRAFRHQHVNRLAELLKQKRALDSKVGKYLSQLQQAVKAHGQQLHICMDVRRGTLSGA